MKLSDEAVWLDDKAKKTFLLYLKKTDSWSTDPEKIFNFDDNFIIGGECPWELYLVELTLQNPSVILSTNSNGYLLSASILIGIIIFISTLVQS